MIALLSYCESDADHRTVAELLDQVVMLRCSSWVAENYEQDPTLVRAWVADTNGRPWFDVHRVRETAASLDVRLPHGKFGGEPGGAGAIMLATIASIVHKLRRLGTAVEGLIFTWDMDKQRDAREVGLRQALEHRPWPADLLIVMASPDPKREAWILAGFEPQDDDERSRLKQCRQDLGFWPNEQPHKLTSSQKGSKLDAKRVLVDVLAVREWERERECLRIGGVAARERLRSRGQDCGLEEFLMQVERRVVPAIDPSKQDSHYE